MQSPERCVLNEKTEQWLISRMIIAVCLSWMDNLPVLLLTEELNGSISAMKSSAFLTTLTV
jgi:hypothetical protein